MPQTTDVFPGSPVIDVVCAGTPFEMGREQGSRLRERILAALESVSELEAFRLQRPRWMPFVVFRRLAEYKASRFMQRALCQTRISAAERLAGIAEGATVPRRKLDLFFALEAVLSQLDRETVSSVNAGCSAVAVTSSAAESGEPIVAHNFDYLPLVQPFYVLRESHPKSKLRSLEFTVAPLCGAVDGINEAGLCITCNYAYVTDHGEAAPTMTMLVSECLAECRTVNEAVERIAGTARFGGGILMLADSRGKIASLEISSTRSFVREPLPGKNRLCHTNRFRSADMKCVELESDACYAGRSPRVLRGLPVHESSDRRDARFEQLLEFRDCFSAAELHKIMSDHGETEVASNGTICMHSDYWYTTASLQLFPSERKIRVAYDTACNATFNDFCL